MLGGEVRSLGPTKPDFSVARVLSPRISEATAFYLLEEIWKLTSMRVWGSAVRPGLGARPLGMEKAKPPAVSVALWEPGRPAGSSQPCHSRCPGTGRTRVWVL